MRASLIGLLVTAIAGAVFATVGARPASADPMIIPVTTPRDTVNAADGLTSLREAISLAANESEATIELQARTVYRLTRCGNQSEDANVMGDLDILTKKDGDSRLTIQGKTSTIKQTCQSERVVDDLRAAGGEEKEGDPLLVVSDVTITGGRAVGDGGGIRVPKALLALENNTVVRENTATKNGGGISGGTVWVYLSTVRSNRAGASGGGIHVSQYVDVTDSTVEKNKARDGGGIASSGADLGEVGAGLWTSTVNGNVAARAGGGVLTSKGHLWVERSTVSGNRAVVGGGVLSLTSASFRYSTIVTNEAAIGANVASDVPRFDASVIALGRGGGKDCHLRGPADPNDDVAFAWNSFDGDGSCLGGLPPDDDNDVLRNVGNMPAAGDPILEPLVDNGGPTATHAPKAESRLVNAFVDPGCGIQPGHADQRGVARPQFGRCDIGAVEIGYQQPPPRERTAS